MKWYGFMIPFIMKYFNSHSQSPTSELKTVLKDTAKEMADHLALKGRSLVFAGIAGMSVCAIMVGSFFMFLIDASRQFDSTSGVAWNATLSVSTVLFILSFGALSYIYLAVWPGARSEFERQQNHAIGLNNEKSLTFSESSRTPAQKSPSQIESALSLLVLDYIEDRQNRRRERYAARALAKERASVSRQNYSWPEESTRPSNPASNQSSSSNLHDRIPDNFH